MLIRPCEKQDIADICRIYNYYIQHTVVTFEEIPITPLEMERRISSCVREFPWLVSMVQDKLVGYAYATRWKGRSAYKNAVEVSVYVSHKQKRHGYGEALYLELIQLLGFDYHALIAGIALPNDASIKLHQKLGFKQVAHFPEVGRKFDRWVDVGYWQKLICDESS